MSGTANVLAGRYQLQEQIAVGGIGEVRRAANTVLGRAVAVKLLRPEYAGHAETLARFRAEARHAARLSHPGIVGEYDYGQDGPAGIPFLVMELVDGPPLAGGPLDPRWVLDMIGQVAAGLAGTVITVQPAGQVPAGATGTVTAAVPPPGTGSSTTAAMAVTAAGTAASPPRTRRARIANSRRRWRGATPIVGEGMDVNGLITGDWAVSVASILAALAVTPVLRWAVERVRSRRGALTGTYIALTQTGDMPALLTGIVRCRQAGKRLNGNIAARACGPTVTAPTSVSPSPP